MITVEVPIRDKKDPPALKFPERCVHCGKLKHTIMPLSAKFTKEKKSLKVTFENDEIAREFERLNL